jgi:molybdopterin-containing oxidoreductase family membrane subunit
MAQTKPTPEVMLEGTHTYESLDEKIGSIALDQKQHAARWFAILGVAFLGVNALLASIAWLLYKGIGVWGNNQPVGWGFDIINFVWWIGIGHAGTLISAILLLLRQQWRNSINRFAEAMTLFAVMCAGLYPLLHTGRPWVAYWLFPYPNILAMWPQFRSPLIWDVFAVSTYITVSALFWFVGLIPDFATLRDRVRSKIARPIFGVLAMGWRGSAKHWLRYETSYLILAGLSTPLVLSVHSIVSLDFAVSIVPGWNVTIFPPYFVAGAVFAGFAMVLTFAIPLRRWYKLEGIITMTHIDWMCKIMLATGLIVFYGYIMEFFYAWYSGNPYELFLKDNRMSGPYAVMFWSLWLCNGLVPQILWSPKMRRNLPVVFVVSQFVSIGMWLERFVIIPMSLHRDYLPSSWGMYTPTIVDWAMFIGTMGFFVFMMFLFIRFLPMINIFEMKELLYRVRGKSPESSKTLSGPVPTMGGKGGE